MKYENVKKCSTGFMRSVELAKLVEFTVAFASTEAEAASFAQDSCLPPLHTWHSASTAMLVPGAKSFVSTRIGT